MSFMTTYLEILIHSVERDKVYVILKEQGWTEKEIDELYETYFGE